MSGTSSVRVGDKGRIVIPADLRDRRGWVVGTTLIAVEQDNGVLLLEHDEALARIRGQLAGRDLVTELFDERREAARRDDAGPA